MRILAISDWRIMPLRTIRRLVRQEGPDVILYAGDDLGRLIPVENWLLLVTPSHSVPLKLPGLDPERQEDREFFTAQFEQYLGELQAPPVNRLLKELPVPFHYVNGNDDYAVEQDGQFFLRIPLRSKSFFSSYISETPGKKITIRRCGYAGPHILLRDMTFPAEVYRRRGYAERPPGFYAAISPSFGRFLLRKGRERVSVFGCQSPQGTGDEVAHPPSAHADIYLTHLPPRGALDLSARHRVRHIGSKKLLETVKRYQPRVVICGHSHIWGGCKTQIGRTVVVNVSSSDRDPWEANYAIIDTRDWSVHLATTPGKGVRPIRGITSLHNRLGEFVARAPSRQAARAAGELYRATDRQALKELRSDAQLMDLVKEAEQLEGFDLDMTRLKLRIRSRRWRQPRIDKRSTLDPAAQAFVDVETGLAHRDRPGGLWLIGILYQGELRQYRYPGQFGEFLAYLRKHQITSLASWTGYDQKALQPFLKRVKPPLKFIDACRRAAHCVIWHSYALHDLHRALFADEGGGEELIPGRIAGLYADHLILNGKRCRYCPPKGEVVEQIKARNREDLLQMLEICQKLRAK